MLFVALAGLSGLVWGVGDFAGGKATQTAGALPVAVLSKLFGLPLLTLYLALFSVSPVLASLAWGAVAGLVGMVGIVLFYRALSAGAMTVVAPVTAVTSAAIPVAVGLLSGERPSGVRLIGVFCALLAIALVSLAPDRSATRTVVTGRLLGLALAAGALPCSSSSSRGRVTQPAALPGCGPSAPPSWPPSSWADSCCSVPVPAAGPDIAPSAGASWPGPST